MTVVLDTNALMMPVESGVRVFAELERLFGAVDPVIPRAVYEELQRLAGGASEEATAASVGLDLADRCTIVEHEAAHGDNAVFEVATRTDVDYAVTNDRPLRDRLLEAGVPVVSLRGRNKLAITRP
jgi:hypothetical protein